MTTSPTFRFFTLFLVLVVLNVSLTQQPRLESFSLCGLLVVVIIVVNDYWLRIRTGGIVMEAAPTTPLGSISRQRRQRGWG